MTPREHIDGDWYDFPVYYDIAFQEETTVEANFVEAVWNKYGDGSLRRILEPGCGSGRLMLELAERGYDACGFDASPAALAYLQTKLSERSLGAEVFTADLAAFAIGRPVDLAHSFCNTFRHLLNETAARTHLESTAASLRSGGLYILGLHLMPIDADPNDCEQWTEIRDDVSVTVTLKVYKTMPDRRREILRVSMDVKSPVTNLRVRSWMPLRIYSVEDFVALLDSVGSFELVGVFDFLYDLDQPVELDEWISDTVVVLKKR